jgi:flavin reductase (DIM6/NTAB) family NADH-FMN oxidoreductase RutF
MADQADVPGLALALGRVPSGLFILTARQAERETGMLASWVQQCSFDPPQLTVCIRRDRDVVAWLTAGAPFTVNIVAEGQQGLIGHFGKGFTLDEPAFTGLQVERPDGEAPVLRDALGYLLCRVAGRHLAGDHKLIVGAIVGGGMNLPDARPRVHIRKNGLRY